MSDTPPGAPAARAVAQPAIAAALCTAVIRWVRGATAEAGPRLRRFAGSGTVLASAYLLFLFFDNQLLAARWKPRCSC